MAKDDYYVIVYKVLAYLYTQLKSGELVDPKMLSHDGRLFQINESYWLYILENMQEQGFIKNIRFTKAWQGTVLIDDLDQCQITPAGIGYLLDNDLLSKAKQWLKEAKEIVPFI